MIYIINTVCINREHHLKHLLVKCAPLTFDKYTNALRVRAHNRRHKTIVAVVVVATVLLSSSRVPIIQPTNFGAAREAAALPNKTHCHQVKPRGHIYWSSLDLMMPPLRARSIAIHRHVTEWEITLACLTQKTHSHQRAILREHIKSITLEHTGSPKPHKTPTPLLPVYFCARHNRNTIPQ